MPKWVAAPAGATVVVCPGTYVEDVTVNKPLTIEGSGATVAPARPTPLR